MLRFADDTVDLAEKDDQLKRNGHDEEERNFG